DAAIMAANLSGNVNKIVRDMCLLDVTPLSLGVELVGVEFRSVIPRNTPIRDGARK
ncbi:heat shock cognate 70 kDa protein-like protein, partial [Tanacetum coccineum]